MKTDTQINQYKGNQLLAALLLLLVLILPTEALAEINVTPQDINAIINTREIAVEALNSRDFTKVKPYLHPQFTITTVDNQVFHNIDEFETYWNAQFSGSVKDIDMKFTDQVSRTFLTPEIEVADGEAIATFNFTNGDQRTMAMCWTAVLEKVANNWMIQSVHFSSNLLDNPMLDAARQQGKIWGIATGIGGFVLGILAMLLWRRQPKPITESEKQSVA